MLRTGCPAQEAISLFNAVKYSQKYRVYHDQVGHNADSGKDIVFPPDFSEISTGLDYNLFFSFGHSIPPQA